MPEEGYVYIVQGVDTQYVKVGKSTNPLERIKTLEHGLPFPLCILLIRRVADMETEEKHLLGIYASYRTRGEWFSLPPEQLDRLLAPRHASNAIRAQDHEEGLVNRGGYTHEEMVSMLEHCICNILQDEQRPCAYSRAHAQFFRQANSLPLKAPALIDMYEYAWECLVARGVILETDARDCEPTYVLQDHTDSGPLRPIVPQTKPNQEAA